MFTIVVNSQKGGSGKSSLCRVLGVEASRRMHSVFLIDTDDQGSLRAWHEARAAEEPRRVEVSAEALPQGLALLGQHGAEFVFIDTPPNASDRLDDVFALADLVVIPIKPTPDDLKSAAVTVARVKALGRPFLFVITQAIQNTNITAQAIAALSHHGRVAQTIMVNRVSYPAAFTDGRSPQEIEPKGQAAREIGKLWENIEACLHANMTEERKAANG